MANGQRDSAKTLPIIERCFGESVAGSVCCESCVMLLVPDLRAIRVASAEFLSVEDAR
jgi:hypothetical protein